MSLSKIEAITQEFKSMSKKGGLASISQGSSDVHQIDPRQLHVKNGWNVRDWSLQENKDHIEQLSWSIGEIGVKQPLTVVWQDNKAWIDDGECRYRAVMLCIERGINVKTVPCRSAERIGANEVDRRFNRYIANTGKQFNQLELAQDFKWFLDQGWDQASIAKKAGLSQGRVSQILATLTMPQPVKALVAAGTVSTSLAMDVVRTEGENAGKVLAQAAQTVKDEGGTTIKPSHVGKVNVKALIVDMLDAGDIDDSDEECVVLKVSTAKWEALKAALKY